MPGIGCWYAIGSWPAIAKSNWLGYWLGYGYIHGALGAWRSGAVAFLAMSLRLGDLDLGVGDLGVGDLGVGDLGVGDLEKW